MKSRIDRVGSVLILVVSFACAIVALIAQGGDAGEVVETIILYLSFLAFGVIGTIVLYGRGSRVMGWWFILVSFLWTSGDVALYVGKDLYAGSDPGPFAPLAAWYVEWYWIPLITGQLAIIPMIFPNGRPMNAFWKRIVRVAGGLIVFFTLAAALDPKLDIDGKIVGDNVLGISPLGDLEDGGLAVLFFPFMFLSAITAAVSLILRFRRSRGDERQQMKWFVLTGTAFVVVFFALVIIDVVGLVRPPILDAIMSALLPVGLGIAVLKYRLYDIDVIVNRAIVYASLTALLVAFYLASVVGLQVLLDPITQDSDVAIAASTLAAAALFRPLRTRVQTFIDRRFYRRKYDAAQVVQNLTLNLRDQVEMDAVRNDIIEALRDTVQPAHATVWVRTR